MTCHADKFYTHIQLLEWFPDKHLPKVDELEQKITALMQERSDKNELYQSVSQKSKDLSKAQKIVFVINQNRFRSMPHVSYIQIFLHNAYILHE